MSTTLLETVAVRGRISRERSVIHDVKIIGRHSRNGREYTEECLRSAVGLYEASPVFCDHKQSPFADRSARDRIGTIRNVRVGRGGLFGDLHVIATHEMAESLFWAAQNDPAAYGLSHNAVGRGRQRGDVYVVEAIDKVHSVDIVAQPATTGGLFESVRTTASRMIRQRVDDVRRRMRALSVCCGRPLPQTARAFAESITSADAGPGDFQQPDPTVARFVSEAEAVLRRTDLSIEAKLTAIERLLRAAETAQEQADEIDQVIQDIISQPATESQRFAARIRGDMPASDRLAFVESIKD